MLIGHEKIIADLKNLANKNQLSHGYIFFGPAMVGKRTAAMHLANFLETGEFAEPFDLVRPSSPQAAQGRPHVLQDMLLVGPDEKGTLGIDVVRQLKAFLWQKPNVSKYRVAIVDGGELMTPEAQNALLKIAEEPPQSSLLILITNDIEGLLPTISSRLQRIYFGTVSEKLVADWLTKEYKLVKKSADELAKRSGGKPGLAHALKYDEHTQEVLKSAEALLRLSEEKPARASAAGGQRDFIKKLLDDDEFDFAKFLDAMILSLAADNLSEKNKIARWHKFLALRHDVAYFNLNPKLQLENLLN